MLPYLKIANFLNVAPKRWWKSYNVNVFPSLKIANFSTSPPRGDAKKTLPCERICSPWKSPIFSTSSPRGDAKKHCYHVNVVSLFENCQFPQHQPQEIMLHLTYFSSGLFKILCKMVNQTQFPALKIANFRQNVPPFFDQIKAARAARKRLSKMASQTQIPALKIGNVRQIVPLFFHQMIKATRAARKKYM